MTSEITGEEIGELLMLAEKSKNLDSAEVEKLESAIKTAPNDPWLRIPLLTYYKFNESSSEKSLQHLLWYIENNFKWQILSQFDVARCNGSHIDELKEAWLKVIQSDPQNVELLKKAIKFFSGYSDVANEFRFLASSVDKKSSSWPRALAASYLNGIRSAPASELDGCARKAIHFAKEALERHKQFPESSYLHNDLNTFVNDLVEACFRFNLLDDAKYFGNYLVEYGKKQQAILARAGSESSEQACDAAYQIHIGHSIQGRAALQGGDTDLALIQLGKMPFFIDMDFEYDLLFAQALLNKGKKPAVCGYLDDCIQNLTTSIEHTVPGDPVYERAQARCARRKGEINFSLRRAEELIEDAQDWITAIYAGEEVEFPTYFVRGYRMIDLDSPHFATEQVESKDVRKLERKLRRDPFDLRSRLLMLKYHRLKNDDKFLEHMFFLIENKPEIDFKRYEIWAGGNHSDAIEAAWTQAIEKDPNNLRILKNAISCCSALSKDTTKKWLEHALKIDPLNEEWPRQLSFQYYLATIGKPDEQAKPNAIQAIALGKHALNLHKQSQYPNDVGFNVCAECERQSDLSFRFNLLDDAQYFGEYLVEHGQARQKTWDGEAISLMWHVSDVHQGHSILGRIALRRNDLEQVLFHLARMQFHVSIDFRPDLEFAQELLDHGKPETVCGYLDDCKKHFTTVLDLMIEEGPFYWAVLQDHDTPIEGPGFLLDNLRARIADIEEWQTKIRSGEKIQLPDRM